MKKFALIFFVTIIAGSIFAFSCLNGNNTGTLNATTELEGKWSNDIQGMTFTFSGDNFSITSPNPDLWYKGPMELKTNKTPKQIDIKIKESGIPQYTGKTALGIYKIEGDKLTLALNEPGSPKRPPSFEETGNAMVFELTKQK